MAKVDENSGTLGVGVDCCGVGVGRDVCVVATRFGKAEKGTKVTLPKSEPLYCSHTLLDLWLAVASSTNYSSG